MLVLSRRREEKILIGPDIEVVVLHVGQDGVKLGVRAPKSVAVFRGELYEQVASENRAAAGARVPQSALLAALRKQKLGGPEALRKQEPVDSDEPPS